jgi:hypothetical protein
MTFSNDYITSFAQENVSFVTRVIRQQSIGDNYWKVMIFVEDDRFVDSTSWDAVPGVTGAKAFTVTLADYGMYATGILSSWLTCLYANGFAGDCILVTIGASEATADEKKATLEAVYEVMKPYAYHKAVCVGATGFDSALVQALGAKANASYDDKMLSSVPYVQMTISEYPAGGDKAAIKASITTSTEYQNCMLEESDAFMAVHADSSKNAALFSLGIALGYLNGTGLRVGNALEMTKTGNISSSGLDGAAMPRMVREAYEELYIQTFKPVGDNTGFVAGYGEKSLKGEDVVARWVVGYITYMTKVRIAQLLTTPNFRKTELNYKRIVFIMSDIVNTFSLDNGGCLAGVNITAPPYNQLPPAQNDEIIIEDAWRATFMGVVHDVDITGNLYIGE